MRNCIKTILVILCVTIAAAAVFNHFVRLKIRGRWEGIYLLRSSNGKPYVLKDDIYLGDGHRLVGGVTFWWLRPSRSLEGYEKEAPCLYYEWDEKYGNGFVRNFLPGGARITTSFSRYNYVQEQSDNEKDIEVHGLFVGGGLPPIVGTKSVPILNETGMAYWDGRRWYHLWCSVNEGIAPADTRIQITPEEWKFLGSNVLKGTKNSVAITSSHEIMLQGQILRMDRFAYFRAGNPYFLLSIWLKNMGDKPVSYYYTYADEPWLGDFGSSEGNVGWVKDRLITNVQYIDTRRYNYAGFFDYGNKESHDFTWAANFIEWFGGNTPAVYFSNGPDDIPPPAGIGKELTSDTRFIALQWGPHSLAPGDKTVYVMAIGMAGNNPATGFPVKPEIKLRKMPR